MFFFASISDPEPFAPQRKDQEHSMQIPPQDLPLGPEVVTYEVVEAASKQQRKKQIDNRGYSYNVKEKTKTTTYWQCSSRTKKVYCKATVIQLS